MIRDHFWTFFQDPSSDLFITQPQYQHQANPLLALPGQLGGLLDLPTQWLKYRHLRNQYEDLRQKVYSRFQPQGTGISDIWNNNPNAFLSIFRHGDSASVRHGLLGAPPRTLWMMDYPLLEQTYYELVVNFDVFGTTSHQAQTRLYFDLIRYAAETNFLRLMPADQRSSILDSWYLDSGKIKLWLDYPPIATSIPAADSQNTLNPILGFEERLLRSKPSWTGSDPINRCTHFFGCAQAGVPLWQAHAERAFSGLIPNTAATLPVILRLPEATLIRVHTANGQQMFYSMLRNRAHTNVAFILGEDWRYEPQLDNISIEPGLLTSYPNFAFDVPAHDINRFVHDLGHVRTDQEWEQLIQHWGVRRSSDRFWPTLDHLIDFMNNTEPRESAIPDINRYENL